MLWPSQQNMCYDMFFLSTFFTGFEPDLKSGGSKWGWLRFPKGFAPSRNCSVDFWSSDLISPNLSSHCQYQSICGNTSSVITPKFRAQILNKTLYIFLTQFELVPISRNYQEPQSNWEESSGYEGGFDCCLFQDVSTEIRSTVTGKCSGASWLGVLFSTASK